MIPSARRDLRPVYPGDFLVSMSLDWTKILGFSKAFRLKSLVRGCMMTMTLVDVNCGKGRSVRA